MSNEFNELFAANNDFQSGFKSQDLTGFALKGLAIVTCMDSRIETLKVV